MSGERFVVAALGRARAQWFRTVATWATSGVVPVEFVGCVSAEELRILTAGRRPFSAALLDGGHTSVDRELIGHLREHGVTPLVVDTHPGSRDWGELGVRATLSPAPTRGELLDVLRSTAVPVGRGELTLPDRDTRPRQPGIATPVIVVCGPGGTGASTVAMALAQGLATGENGTRGRGAARLRPRDRNTVAHHGRRTVLADLCLRADQAVLHDSRDIVPGVQELVEAHRLGRPDPPAVRSLTFSVADRGYHLLLGLRRPTNWTAIRPRTFAAALDGLREAFDLVVADVEPELETEDDTGSIDVEERAAMAQITLRAAAVAVVVGRPGVAGMHGLVRALQQLVDFGIDPGRLLPVCTSVRRGSAWRAGYTRAVAELVDLPADASPLPGLVFLPRRPVDEAVYDGTALPRAVTRPVTRAVGALLARRPAQAPLAEEPEPVRPGSLGLADR